MRAHEKAAIREICANELRFHEGLVKAQKTLVEANEEPILQQFFETQLDSFETALRAVNSLIKGVLEVVNREASEGDK